jgi:hypothetical protein
VPSDQPAKLCPGSLRPDPEGSVTDEPSAPLIEEGTLPEPAPALNEIVSVLFAVHCAVRVNEPDNAYVAPAANVVVPSDQPANVNPGLLNPEPDGNVIDEPSAPLIDATLPEPAPALKAIVSVLGVVVVHCAVSVSEPDSV